MRSFNGNIFSQGLFDKILKAIESAVEQMRAFCSDAVMKMIVYMILNIDDSLHKNLENYICQIQNRLGEILYGKFEIVFDVKPPFHSAMSEPLPSRLYYCFKTDYGVPVSKLL